MGTFRFYADVIDRYILSDGKTVDRPRYKMQQLVHSGTGYSWLDVPYTVSISARIITTELKSGDDMVST